MSTNNSPSRKSKRTIFDEQPNAVAITEEEFEKDDLHAVPVMNFDMACKERKIKAENTHKRRLCDEQPYARVITKEEFENDELKASPMILFENNCTKIKSSIPDLLDVEMVMRQGRYFTLAVLKRFLGNNNNIEVDIKAEANDFIGGDHESVDRICHADHDAGENKEVSNSSQQLIGCEDIAKQQ